MSRAQEEDFDDFADIINNQAGVFGDTAAALDHGLKAMDTVDVAVTPAGAVLEFRCVGCGRPRQLTLDYPELVALKMRISPHMAFKSGQHVSDPTTWRWVKEEHRWGLVMQCNMCPYHYAVRLGAQEPDAILSKARRAGYINPAGEQGVVVYVNQMRQRYGKR